MGVLTTMDSFLFLDLSHVIKFFFVLQTISFTALIYLAGFFRKENFPL